MSDTQRYEIVLKELRELLATMPDFAGRVIMIGGQVLALEARSRGGDGQLTIDTQVGELLDRGFSFEADLLLDFEGLVATDHFETRLRDRGYQKKSGFAWSRDVEGYEVELEFFRAEEASEEIAPVRTTPVPGGQAAIARARELTVQVPGGKRRFWSPTPSVT